MKVDTHMFVNGIRVLRRGIRTEVEEHKDGTKRLFVHVPVELALAMVVEDAALAAVARKANFGWKAMQALVDRLPRCEAEATDCIHPATQRTRSGVLLCTGHANNSEETSEDLEYAGPLRELEVGIAALRGPLPDTEGQPT